MTTPSLDITIRPMADGDLSFVMSSWKKSNRDSSKLPNGLYFNVMQHRIHGILEDDKTKLLVATAKASPDFIMGWACANRGILHYAYTRQSFRRARVATRLLDALGLLEPLTVTHWTHSAEGVSKKHRFRYEPERLEE